MIPIMWLHTTKIPLQSWCSNHFILLMNKCYITDILGTNFYLKKFMKCQITFSKAIKKQVIKMKKRVEEKAMNLKTEN